MTPPALDHHKFAPPASSPGACAKGGRRSPLLASAATSLDHSQRQRLTGTALGRRLVMYRSTLGVAKTGRFGGLGCVHIGLCRVASTLLFDLPDYHLAGALIGPGSFLGNRRDGNRTFASIIQHRRQGRFQRFAKGQPSHFPMSFHIRRLDSHDANENGLTDAKTSFAPGAKAHD